MRRCAETVAVGRRNLRPPRILRLSVLLGVGRGRVCRPAQPPGDGVGRCAEGVLRKSARPFERGLGLAGGTSAAGADVACESLPRDYARAIRGQGIPPPNCRARQALHRSAQPIHCIEDASATRFCIWCGYECASDLSVAVGMPQIRVGLFSPPATSRCDANTHDGSVTLSVQQAFLGRASTERVRPIGSSEGDLAEPNRAKPN